MEGRSLFSTNHPPRSFVIGVRDRLGVAIDRVRCVRTERFRYIRNYYTDRPLYQLQYRESYASLKTLRDLYATERLSPLQASYHQENQRPPEELYDLSNDPDQVKNLAGDPKYAEELKSHRVILNDWIQATGDQGQFPAAPEELRAVFEAANGQVSNPEYDFITK